MSIKLVDTAVPMNETGYPVARAKHIWFDDDIDLETKLSTLGGGTASSIGEYDQSKSYSTKDVCIYNNYLWICTSATTGTFDESKWDKLSDDITELSKDDVKAMLGLTQDQIDTLSNIISTEIRTDKCFSSSETYTRINDALQDAKDYCDQQASSSPTVPTKTSELVNDSGFLTKTIIPSTEPTDKEVGSIWLV